MAAAAMKIAIIIKIIFIAGDWLSLESTVGAGLKIAFSGPV